MSVDLEKTEYNYFLKFFLNLAEFGPMTSTFRFVEEKELNELNLTISVLQRKLSAIMPMVQDREATSYANDAKDAVQSISRDSRVFNKNTKDLSK